jgi:small membrane protein
MNGIQVLLLTGVFVIALYFFVRLRNVLFDLVLLMLLIAAAVVFILFPNKASEIAHWLGVGRGADLVFYVSILLFWFIILKLYARIRRLEQTLTNIVRKDAKDQATEPGKNN